MNTFQLIITGVFAFFLIFGFLVFSGILPLFNNGGSTSGIKGTVVVWGTHSREKIAVPLKTLNEKNKDSYQIEYREIRSDSFDEELVEALASGREPDAILLPQDLILRHRDKVFLIPYESFGERAFKDTFIEEGELYLSPNAVIALPFSVDPMVMYWNRDMFSDAGLANPPRKWDELFALVPLMTDSDEVFNIKKSSLALGEYRNINHAKDILSILTIQAGNPIIENTKDGLSVVLEDQRGFVTPPAQSSLRFYTEFSNPVKPVYSWNRALPNSQDFFIAGDLAIYFGYASEYAGLRAKSPHLNFDVALLPQPQEFPRKATFGKMTGAAILKTTDNLPTAFKAVFELTSASFLQSFSEVSSLPPVRRDLLAKRQTNAVLSVFYDSALISKAWLDPRPEKTESIFRVMIENVISGRAKMSGAVGKADAEIQKLLQ